MSLRFDRKASSKLRSSFSCRTRTEKERDEERNRNREKEQEGALQSWPYRQSQFACDYLNLIEPPITSAAKKNNIHNFEEKRHEKKCVKKENSNNINNSHHHEGQNTLSGSSSGCSVNGDFGSLSASKNSKTGFSKELPGNTMSAAAAASISMLGSSTLSIPASCVTTSSRSSFNSSVISTESSGSGNSSSSSNNSFSSSLYADLFDLGFGAGSSSSSSLIFRVSLSFQLIVSTYLIKEYMLIINNYSDHSRADIRGLKFNSD